MSPFMKQLWTISAVLLDMVGIGMMYSYPSCLLPALKAPDSPIPIDTNTAALIVSSIGPSAIPGSFISTYLMDTFGRKIAHYVAVLAGIIGWLCIAFAPNVTTILIGRILTGVTGGGTVGLGAIAIGEFSSPKNRGVYLNLKTCLVAFGSMTTHILANFLHWKTVAWISTAPFILSFFMTITWTESPAYYAYKQDYEKCKKSFFVIRGKDPDSIKELDDMIQAQMNRKVEDISLKEKILGLLKKFTKKDFVKPILITSVGGVLLEVSGRHVFPAFAPKIVGEVTGSKSQSFYCTLGIDIIIILSLVVSTVMVKIMKRRKLLFSTGWPSVIVLAIACTYLVLVSKDIISKDYPWIPMSLFVLYFILCNLGCTPIPLTFLGEVFPLAHKAAGLSVAFVILCIIMSVTLQATVILMESVGVSGTFFVFGFCIACCLAILHFIMPETKDRTLQEIENYLNYGYYRKENGMREADEELKMIQNENTNMITR